MSTGEFHNRDGWHFKRNDDGSVRIQKRTPDSANTVEHTHVIPPNEWASIVAHVAAKGETADTYALATALHTGTRRRESDVLVIGGAIEQETLRAMAAEKAGDSWAAETCRINVASLREIQRTLV